MEGDQAVRQLDDDQDPVRTGDIAGRREHLESLGNGQMLDHGVEQHDVDPARVAAQCIDDLLGRVDVKGGALRIRHPPRDADRFLVDVQAYVAACVGRKGAGDRAGPAAVLEDGGVLKWTDAFDPGSPDSVRPVTALVDVGWWSEGV